MVDNTSTNIIKSKTNISTSAIKLDTLKKAKKPNLTNAQRQQIYEILLESSLAGKLPHGILSKVGREFGVSSLTISRIWNQGRKSLAEGSQLANVDSQIPSKSGRKKKPIDLAIIETLPVESRTSFKAISQCINIPKSTLFDALRGCLVKRGSFYHLKRNQTSRN